MPRRRACRDQLLPGVCLLVASLAASWHFTGSTFVSTPVTSKGQRISFVAPSKGLVAAVEVDTSGSSLSPCLMLCAAALCATYSVRRRADRSHGQRITVVVNQALPVQKEVYFSRQAAACMDNVSSQVAVTTSSDLLGLEACQPAANIEDLIPALPATTSPQESVTGLGFQPFQPSQRSRRSRQASGRRERRQVGARLMQQQRAEPVAPSFEPSAVAMKIQGVLQGHSRVSSCGHDRKARSRAEGCCSAEVGFQSFTINSMDSYLRSNYFDQ